jgi:hypothetical protein
MASPGDTTEQWMHRVDPFLSGSVLVYRAGRKILA